MHSRKILFIAAPILAAILGGIGASAFALPDVKLAGSVEYITGGIGRDESQEMQAQARSWPLSLEFAVKAGNQAQWMSKVDVTVTDSHGKTAFQVTSEGPLLMARLAPGDYTVRASAAGTTFDRKVHIAAGAPAHAVFVWPQGSPVG